MKEYEWMKEWMKEIWWIWMNEGIMMKEYEWRNMNEWKNNDEGIFVIPIPGPSAVISSLSISGFSDQFYFHGFLSETNNSISKEFDFLKSIPDPRNRFQELF